VEGNVAYIVISLFFVLLSASILNSRNEGYTVMKFYIYVSLSSFMLTLHVEVWPTFTIQYYTKNCVLHEEFSFPVLFSDLTPNAINGKKHMMHKHHVTKACVEVEEESNAVYSPEGNNNIEVEATFAPTGGRV
jgi:hypothetical protein